MEQEKNKVGRKPGYHWTEEMKEKSRATRRRKKEEAMRDTVKELNPIAEKYVIPAQEPDLDDTMKPENIEAIEAAEV